jgi:hypothetical protein
VPVAIEEHRAAFVDSPVCVCYGFKDQQIYSH